jgi:sigma-B regulation protein RsbU (phosphoserine phosphatase)
MLHIINLSLVDRPIDAQYISMIYSVWDDSTLTLRLTNSGLPRPIHCHNGKTQRIEVTGLPLGLFATAEYDETQIQAADGDVFLLFSDGILDARSRHGDLFGSTRVEKIVEQHAHASAQEIVDAVFDAVSAHAAGVDAFDDQTIVALKVKGSRTRQ